MSTKIWMLICLTCPESPESHWKSWQNKRLEGQQTPGSPRSSYWCHATWDRGWRWRWRGGWRRWRWQWQVSRLSPWWRWGSPGWNYPTHCMLYFLRFLVGSKQSKKSARNMRLKRRYDDCHFIHHGLDQSWVCLPCLGVLRYCARRSPGPLCEENYLPHLQRRAASSLNILIIPWNENVIRIVRCVLIVFLVFKKIEQSKSCYCFTLKCWDSFLFNHETLKKVFVLIISLSRNFSLYSESMLCCPTQLWFERHPLVHNLFLNMWCAKNHSRQSYKLMSD